MSRDTRTCRRELAETSRGSTEAGCGSGGADDSVGAAAGPATEDKGSDVGFAVDAAEFEGHDADASSAGDDEDKDGGFACGDCVFASGSGTSCGLKFSLGAADAVAGCCSCCCSSLAVLASRRSTFSPFNCVSISLLLGSKDSASSASATASAS